MFESWEEGFYGGYISDDRPKASAQLSLGAAFLLSN